uniref:Extracellular globin n=1 Tax=Eudistylia vancouveri TaxID=6364 RepID=Q9BKE9_EUDVA|nr:globin chain a1 precursor [Eudistylia vancouveri]
MLLKVLLITACLVATALAGCNEIKRLKVKLQWAQSFGFENTREDFEDELFRNFFKRKPDAPEKFFTRVRGDNIYSPEFRAFGMRVASGLDMVLSLSDDEAAFQAALAFLKAQHAPLGIGAEFNLAFKEAVLDTVAAHVGRCFDKDAWNACMEIIMTGIQS